MTVQEGLTHPGATVRLVEAEDSCGWWRSRSSDELQAIARRGEKAGDMFLATVAEMERRARDSEAERRAQRAEEVEAARRFHRNMWLALLVLCAAAAAVLRLSGA